MWRDPKTVRGSAGSPGGCAVTALAGLGAATLTTAGIVHLVRSVIS